MRVLYVINTGLVGGLQRHVLCLMKALRGVAETAVVINTEIDERCVEMFQKENLRVYRLHGRSGHDLKIVSRFKAVIHDFVPDIIHAHGIPFLCELWLRCTTKIPVVHSLHTSTPQPGLMKRWLKYLITKKVVDYWLPVSSPTWDMFTRAYPWAKAHGEVFFNPLLLEDEDCEKPRMSGTDRHRFTLPQSEANKVTVGMVGRAANVKDWPSFVSVAHDVAESFNDVFTSQLGNAYDIADPKVVLALPTYEIDGTIKWVDKKAIKIAFRNFGTVVNINDGTQVTFPASSVGKMLYQSGTDISQIVPSFKYLFERSLLAWREHETKLDGHKYHFNVKSYANYVNRFSLGGKEYFVRFTLREIGNEFGVHASTISEVLLYPIENNGAAVDSISENPKDDHAAPSKKMITQLSGDVNKGWKKFVDYKLEAFFRRRSWTVCFVGVGVTREQAVELPGMNADFLDSVDWKGPQSNGREWIGKFDLFVMTSKHEQLPTTVLECFAEGTPICGFIPDGGMTDILQFSTGPLKSAFIQERDCEKLAEVVRRIAGDAEFRQDLIEDGRQILDGHFDAMKNCRGQLMDIYRRFAK